MHNPATGPGDLKALIEREARLVGVSLGPDTVLRLASFAALFLQWNARINLASVASAEELVERHFVDSYVAARFVPAGARVVDVGSGGGLPALPLASIRPDITIDCFEPIQKKCAFLRSAVRELGLAARVSIQAVAVREPIAPVLAGRADVAMSRAALEPQTWLDLGRQLVQASGGRVLVFATIHSGDRLPPPSEGIEYGRNRRLLSYKMEAGG